jgi:hypothetical protein
MNEPVAWLVDNQAYTIKEAAESLSRILETPAIPLYIHPVKELTDEEIGDFTHRMVLCCGVHPNSADINVLGLKFIVEDILKKAQEK